MGARVEETAVSGSEGLARRPIEVLSVVVQGKAHDVVTNAATVGQLLSAMRIEPDGDDVVAPSPSTPLNDVSKVVYAPVAVRTVTELHSVPASPSQIPADAGPSWRVPSLSLGTAGQVLRTYRVRFVDGKAVSRRLIFTRPVRAPVRGSEVANTASGSMVGEASWYYVNDRLNAASPWLPFGTNVTVTNLATGDSVTVVINDRGPYGGRLIDLSEYAFSQIAPLGQGVCLVRISW
jgi:hypothetical protein